MSYVEKRVCSRGQKSCRYPGVDVLFRGPRRSLESPFVAFLGGSNFNGGAVPNPVPDLVETALETTCVNFSIPNAGVDLFLEAEALTDFASDAVLTVVEVLGAQNLSNRFYRVHPRRNDRFLAPTDLLTRAFPGAEFVDVHFTRHALKVLETAAPERFQAVVDELKATWVWKMSALLNRIRGPKLLAWCGPDAPQAEARDRHVDPLFVDARMLNKIAGQVDGIVECRWDRVGARSADDPVAHRYMATALLRPMAELGAGPGTLRAVI